MKCSELSGYGPVGTNGPKAPVDVLAVMDSAIQRNGHRGDNPLELRMQQEARAAVAELIEAATNAARMLPAGSKYGAELRAALARCTGEGA